MLTVKKEDGIQFLQLTPLSPLALFHYFIKPQTVSHYKKTNADFTFDLSRCLLGEREGVWCNDQSGQFTKNQSKYSEESPFALGLVQEVSWTVASHRRLT